MELLEPYMNWIYLGAVVLAVLIFAWLMIRALGGRVRAKRGSRLGISEYYEVDKSRFLVLVRRDDVEHLVLVGGSQDVVIEAGISPRPSRQRARALSETGIWRLRPLTAFRLPRQRGRHRKRLRWEPLSLPETFARWDHVPRRGRRFSQNPHQLIARRICGRWNTIWIASDLLPDHDRDYLNKGPKLTASALWFMGVAPVPGRRRRSIVAIDLFAPLVTFLCLDRKRGDGTGIQAAK